MLLEVILQKLLFYIDVIVLLFIFVLGILVVHEPAPMELRKNWRVEGRPKAKTVVCAQP